MRALGGMRNPPAAKVPKSKLAGEAIRELLLDAASHPEAIRLTAALLGGEKADPLESSLVNKLRELTLRLLAPRGVELPPRTTKAATPISAEILWAWGDFTQDPDPDAKTLALWLIREGAPLGYSHPIPCNGVFPKVKGPQWEEEAAYNLARQFEGWANHPSADEGQEDL